jgi:hypothetical protein
MNGDRVVYASKGHAKPFGQVEEFLEILDE